MIPNFEKVLCPFFLYHSCPMALYFEKPEINTKFNLRTLILTKIWHIYKLIREKLTCSQESMIPALAMVHLVHNVISTFPTFSLLIALSLKFQSSKIWIMLILIKLIKFRVKYLSLYPLKVLGCGWRSSTKNLTHIHCIKI